MPSSLETRLNHRFRLIRLIDKKLIPSDCEIECEIVLDMTVEPQEAHAHLNAMKIWLDEFVDGSVAYDIGIDVNMRWLDDIDNCTMMSPGEPVDHILLSMLHAKLTTIGGSVAKVTKSRLITDTAHGFSTAMQGNLEEWLPTMDEWVGLRRFHDSPWWFRGDASMIDLFPGPQDDVSNVPDLGMLLVDMLRDNITEAKQAEMAEIIKPPFKPRLVDGED